MNVSCPACRSVFRVDPAKVPDAGVRARCSICGTVIDVLVPERAPQPAMADAAVFERGPALRPEDTASTTTSTPALAESLPPAHAEAGAPAPIPAPDPAPVPTRDVSEVRQRPVNPYLNNTPELRARRLARALVSDLVAYNPQKREEGLRDGTLRQLFRDEIRKSWDEYVEQVGANVAESTPHFQDALNDVLAGGRRVF